MDEHALSPEALMNVMGHVADLEVMAKLANLGYMEVNEKEEYRMTTAGWKALTGLLGLGMTSMLDELLVSTIGDKEKVGIGDWLTLTLTAVSFRAAMNMHLEGGPHPMSVAMGEFCND